jgi:hypothetical protein
MPIQIDPGATHHDPPDASHGGDCGDCHGVGKYHGHCGETLDEGCQCPVAEAGAEACEIIKCDRCDGTGEEPPVEPEGCQG